MSNNADNIVEILIRFGLDKSQAEEARREIAQTAQANTEAGRDAVQSDKEQSEAKRELKKSVRELASEIPGVGLAWKLLTNPISAAVGAFLLGAGAMKRSMDQFKEAMKLEHWASSVEGIKAYNEAMGAAQVEVAKLAASLAVMHGGNSDFTDQLKAQNTALKQEEENLNKILAAKKQLELAGATAPGQAEEIEARYSKMSIGQRRAFVARQFAMDNDEMGRLRTTIPGLEDAAKAGAEDIGERKARVAQLEAQKKAAEENFNAAKAENERAKARLGQDDLLRLDPGGAQTRAMREQRDNSAAAMAAAKALAEALKEPLTQAIAGVSGAEANQGRTMAQLQKLNTRRDELENKMTYDAASESRTMAAERTLMLLAQATAKAKEMQAVREQAAKLLQDTGSVPEQLARTLADLQKQIDALNRAVGNTKTAPALN